MKYVIMFFLLLFQMQAGALPKKPWYVGSDYSLLDKTTGQIKSQVGQKKPTFKKIKKQRSIQSSALSPKEDGFFEPFSWLNEQEISFQWAYAFWDQKSRNQYAPSLLKKEVGKDFRDEVLLYLNFHQNIMQVPYILKWGLKASAGLARNYDIKGEYFIPLSLSLIFSFQFFKHQFLTPFFEMGFSSWNVGFSDRFTDLFPFWSAGLNISMSLFKKSLRYTFPEEYGIQDMGIQVELRNNLSPFDNKNMDYFLHSLHVGLYFNF